MKKISFLYVKLNKLNYFLINQIRQINEKEKCTTGHVFIFGSGSISGISILQKCVI